MDVDSQKKEAQATAAGVMPGVMAETFDCSSVFNDQDIFSQVRKPRRVHWSIAWSDLMMTMFILFAVLFIYQAANREFRYGDSDKTAPEKTVDTKPDSAPGDDRTPDIRLEMTKGAKWSPDTLYLDSLAGINNVELKEDQAVKIILPSDLLFEIGRTELRPRAVASLLDIVAVIQGTGDTINVVGHTDNVPLHSAQYATNWELSVIRACTVARFLIEEMNVPAERFYIGGRSYYQPIQPNDTMANRAKNRRVEIILTKTK